MIDFNNYCYQKEACISRSFYGRQAIKQKKAQPGRELAKMVFAESWEVAQRREKKRGECIAPRGDGAPLDKEAGIKGEERGHDGLGSLNRGSGPGQR
ncbi:hypothetical protein ACUUL3_12690 [Thiovibrio sp. JS02]